MKIEIEEGQKAEFKATLLENLVAKLVDNNLLANEKVCDGRLWYELEDIIEDHLMKYTDTTYCHLCGAQEIKGAWCTNESCAEYRRYKQDDQERIEEEMAGCLHSFDDDGICKTCGAVKARTK